MATKHDLTVYEEVVLLALRDDKGTVPLGSMFKISVAGAILGELLLLERIKLEEGRRELVSATNAPLTGDAFLDEALQRVRDAKRKAGIGTWLSRFCAMKNIYHRIAGRLVMRGVLRREEQRVLRIFRRDAYPTNDPRVERAIVDRLRKVIFSDVPNPDPRTVLLLSVVMPVGILPLSFEKKELRARRKHMKEVTERHPIARVIRKKVEHLYATLAAG